MLGQKNIQKMRGPNILITVATSLYALLMACGGPAHVPLVETKLPGSDLVVRLVGPDSKGHYRYSVSDRSSVLIDRFLGPAHVASPPMANLTAEGSGRFKIEWISGGSSSFAVIDSTHRIIVGDSKQANPLNQPF